MSDENGRPTYRFRWSNYDLAKFVKERAFCAQRLRADAAVLLRRAEQIEEEAAAWENALEELTP